jgi:hypothetical protein
VPAGAALIVKRHHDKKVTSRAAAETVEQLAYFVNAATKCYNSLKPEQQIPRIGVARGRHGHLVLEDEMG